MLKFTHYPKQYVYSLKYYLSVRAGLPFVWKTRQFRGEFKSNGFSRGNGFGNKVIQRRSRNVTLPW